jgi:tripeptidyl-peptidase-1
LSNDGKNTSTFLPEFPSTCPYVTAVGATMNVNPEIVAWDPVDDFSSGGGFSYYFPRPSYQDGVVSIYADTVDPSYDGLYYKNSRAYPNISASGFHFLTTWNGTDLWLDGTSASTPTASAVLSLVNDALISAGKPPLGFLNPWIYKGSGKAFTDITSGSALGCGVTGFEAGKGWDAVRGWGTKVCDLFNKNSVTAVNDVQHFPSITKALLGY